MAISINPVLPVLPAQEAGGGCARTRAAAGQRGRCQVLKVLSADLVRIAIAALSIDVKTEIPLQEGQTLKLAVSQTRTAFASPMSGRAATRPAHRPDAVTLSPDALVDAQPPRRRRRAKNRADAAENARR